MSLQFSWDMTSGGRFCCRLKSLSAARAVDSGEREGVKWRIRPAGMWWRAALSTRSLKNFSPAATPEGGTAEKKPSVNLIQSAFKKFIKVLLGEKFIKSSRVVLEEWVGDLILEI